MKKEWILDGYNVIHKIPFLADYLDESLQNARQALIELCKIIAGKNRGIDVISIVFDGCRDNGRFENLHSSSGRVKVFFSVKPEQADDFIIELLETKDADHCVVITDDNEVANNARAYRSRVMSVKIFSNEIMKLNAGSRHPSDEKRSPANADQITEEYRKILDAH